jgi:hypothetical protein
MIFNRLQVVCVVILQAAIGATGVQSVLAEEPTKDLLAAQIRDQGYRCSKPLSAKKDLARSRPDQAVWVLRCENANYRLRLVPDMAAHVQRLK